MNFEVHLRADYADGNQTKFSVIINKEFCGQLTMSEEAAEFLHSVILTTRFKTIKDNLYSSGKWSKELKES